jgi:hypothetical protein
MLIVLTTYPFKFSFDEIDASNEGLGFDPQELD